MKRKFKFVYVAFGLVTFATLFLNDRNGRDSKYAGAPISAGVYESTCTSCHSDITHTGTGLTLTGAPTNFVAGTSYPLTLTLNDPNAITGGFQIVATNSTLGNNVLYGTFTAGTGSRLTAGSGAGRLTHSSPKAFSAGKVSWTFNWTAPATGTGVRFYFAGNASNNDGNENTGDAIYTGSQMGALPVELVSFTGKTVDKNVVLTWKTASELNNREFIIERNTEGRADKFENIGAVKGQGNSSGINTYSFTDDAPLAKISYYRLNQVDFDGASTLSNIVSIDKNNTTKAFKVYPNFVAQNTEITIETGLYSAETFDIVDLTGRVVKTIQKTADTAGVKMAVANLASGTYLLRSNSRIVPQAVQFVVF